MTIMDAIITRVHDRRNRWHTFEVRSLPDPEDMNEDVIVGSYSRVGRHSRLRFIRSDVLISVDGAREPPSALARDYLVVEYKQGPRLRRGQCDALRLATAPLPIYSDPCEFDDGAYIDIRACYWTVLNTIGWDIDYMPGRWLGLGMKPFSFPWPDNKPARNCLVSIAASNSLMMWNEFLGLHEVPIYNHMANPGLYRLISDVLNAIASEALRAGAVYVHTDGYIAPNPSIAERIEEIIRDWGFIPRRVARGRGYVLNSQMFRVGPHRTQLLSGSALAMNNVHAIDYARWLRRIIARASADRDRQFDSILADSPPGSGDNGGGHHA